MPRLNGRWVSASEYRAHHARMAEEGRLRREAERITENRPGRGLWEQIQSTTVPLYSRDSFRSIQPLQTSEAGMRAYEEALQRLSNTPITLYTQEELSSNTANVNFVPNPALDDQLYSSYPYDTTLNVEGEVHKEKQKSQTMKKQTKPKIIPDPNRAYVEEKGEEHVNTLINMGILEMAQENGMLRFGSEKYCVYNSVANVVQRVYQDYLSYFMSFGISLEDILNPKNNLAWTGSTYKVVPRDKGIYETIDFSVSIDKESGEILVGKEDLQTCGILHRDKANINKKEQGVVNIRELADFYATKECEFYIRDYNVAKDVPKYIKAYKKHYKQIISFKSTEDEQD